MQVSFGVHEDEESAARQYDRALLIEKGRAAKTNFPLPDYEKEAKEFESFVIKRYHSSNTLGLQAGPVPCSQCTLMLQLFMQHAMLTATWPVLTGLLEDA